MRISKARARFTTSRPMLPRPTMPSVLPRSSLPRNFFFSHLPDAGGGVGLRNVARHRQHQGQRVLGHRDGVAARRVHHQHAGGGGGVQIDVVHADAGAPDHAQLRRLRQHVSALTLTALRTSSASASARCWRVFLGIGNDDVPARLRLQQLDAGRATGARRSGSFIGCAHSPSLRDGGFGVDLLHRGDARCRTSTGMPVGVRG